MKKYQVMIDEEVSSQTFTFDEMLELGLLDDYDENIKVKLLEESAWQIAREYPFHVSESDTRIPNLVVNNDGTSRNNDNRGYLIDEYGQIKRRRPQVESSSDLYNATSSAPSQSNNSSSSSDDYTGCIWAVIVGVGILVLIAIS